SRRDRGVLGGRAGGAARGIRDDVATGGAGGERGRGPGRGALRRPAATRVPRHLDRGSRRRWSLRGVRGVAVLPWSAAAGAGGRVVRRLRACTCCPSGAPPGAQRLTCSSEVPLL